MPHDTALPSKMGCLCKGIIRHVQNLAIVPNDYIPNLPVMRERGLTRNHPRLELTQPLVPRQHIIPCWRLLCVGRNDEGGVNLAEE